jgi:CDP-paratose 2-epimerase
VGKVFITGCAGFIGGHLTSHFLGRGFDVVGVDNLSRNGSRTNLDWLRPKGLRFFNADVRDFRHLSEIFTQNGEFDLVIHEAGQVAVTTSVTDPRNDFEINALGTFNVLEATRLFSPGAFFEFASTNKVYGEMTDIQVVERNGRYDYVKTGSGIDEVQPLDFHSPYGCSKGAADQYVRDYCRIYGLKTVVLRQSCIYGTRQFGIEDQGWVAWFAIASLLKRPISIYGDGKQCRDILWIDDLVEAYSLLYDRREDVAGQVFNVGGGPDNVLSLLELVDLLKEKGLMQRTPEFADWRPGDQKVFICDVGKIWETISWRPKTGPAEGVSRLIAWCRDNRLVLESVLSSV